MDRLKPESIERFLLETASEEEKAIVEAWLQQRLLTGRSFQEDLGRAAADEARKQMWRTIAAKIEAAPVLIAVEP